MKKLLIFSLITIFSFIQPLAVQSEEEDLNYSYGTVIEIKKDSQEIIVSEYDWEKDEEVEVSYFIHNDTIVENIDSWKNIPQESYIDIEYMEKDGKKSAKYIYVYESEPSEIEVE